MKFRNTGEKSATSINRRTTFVEATEVGSTIKRFRVRQRGFRFVETQTRTRLKFTGLKSQRKNKTHFKFDLNTRF